MRDNFDLLAGYLGYGVLWACATRVLLPLALGWLRQAIAAGARELAQLSIDVHEARMIRREYSSVTFEERTR